MLVADGAVDMQRTLPSSESALRCQVTTAEKLWERQKPRLEAATTTTTRFEIDERMLFLMRAM